MKKYLYSKIITKSRTSTGIMFQDDSLTKQKLIRWVYRNCPGVNKIKILTNEVFAYYSDRIEVYYIKEGNVNVQSEF